MPYNTIDEALEALRAGELVLVTDDPDRENEGDLICAAEFANTERVNFMATHAKGLICMPMSEAICRRLALPQMVPENTDNHQTAFTVSIDHISTTTGISARRAQRHRPALRRPRRPAGGVSPPGAHVSAARPQKRRSGTRRPH